MHFLFQCKKYSPERQKAFDILKNECKIQFYPGQEMVALKTIFKMDDLKAVGILGRYIHECFMKRNTPDSKDTYLIIFEN